MSVRFATSCILAIVLQSAKAEDVDACEYINNYLFDGNNVNASACSAIEAYAQIDPPQCGAPLTTLCPNATNVPSAFGSSSIESHCVNLNCIKQGDEDDECDDWFMQFFEEKCLDEEPWRLVVDIVVLCVLASCCCCCVWICYVSRQGFSITHWGTKKAFEKADANNDNVISPEEAKKVGIDEDKFKEMDKNNDKVVDKSEFQAAAEKDKVVVDTILKSDQK